MFRFFFAIIAGDEAAVKDGEKTGGRFGWPCLPASARWGFWRAPFADATTAELPKILRGPA